MGIVKTCKTIRKYYVLIRDLIDPPPPPKIDPNNITFMTYALEVNMSQAGWQKAIGLVLKCHPTDGVRNYRLYKGGKMVVSGIGDLNMLFKMIKKAEKWAKHLVVESGQCSSILFVNDGDFVDYENDSYLGPFARQKEGPIQHQPYHLPPHHSEHIFPLDYDYDRPPHPYAYERTFRVPMPYHY